MQNTLVYSEHCFIVVFKYFIILSPLATLFIAINVDGTWNEYNFTGIF